MSREVILRELFHETITGEWGSDPKSGGNTRVLRSVNFRNDGKIDFSDVANRYLTRKDLERKSISKGNILFEKSGGSPSQPAGRVVFCSNDFKGSCSNFIEIGRVKEEYDELFVFYLLFHFYYSGKILKYQQQTTGIINFKLGEYLDVEKAIIPSQKTEQSKIAEILSSIDKAIDQTEDIIAKQQRIKNGLMQDLLTKGIDENGNLRSEETHGFKDSEVGRIPNEWRCLKFGDIYSEFRTGMTPSRSNPKYFEGDILWVTSGELKYKIIYDTIEKITPEAKRNTNLKLYTSGTFFIAITGLEAEGTRGSCAIIGKEATTNQSCMAFEENDTIHNRFLFHYYKYWGKTLSIKYAQGTKQQSLNADIVGRIYLPVPEKTEQIVIADKMEMVENSIESEVKKLNKLKRKKTGLMQDLLTGKISVDKLINTTN